MVTNPRSTISESTNLGFAHEKRRKKRKQSTPLMSRVLSTLVALLLLGIVLRYLPPGPRDTQLQAEEDPIRIALNELHVAKLQVIEAPGGGALYLDGVITNASKGAVTEATAEISFRDTRGNLVGVMQRPMQDEASAISDQTSGESPIRPIKPGEVRPFRVVVEQVPPDWNHLTPDLNVISVSAQ